MAVNTKDLKIILRFVIWYCYLYNISFDRFWIENIKNGYILKELCSRSILYNMYVTGFIKFCYSLNLYHDSFVSIMKREDELKLLEDRLNKIIENIEKNNYKLDNYNDIYEFLKSYQI